MAAPFVSYSNHPLKDIPEPHPHDVLCGRGGGTNAHIGNSHWRMLVAANKQLYITLPKRQKMLLSRSIVNAVRSQNPPGRFLQKDNKTNLWFDVGDQRAQEKTSQALREGAPDIRKMVATAEEDSAGDTGTADRRENDDPGNKIDGTEPVDLQTPLVDKDDTPPNSPKRKSPKETSPSTNSEATATASVPTSITSKSNKASSIDAPPQNTTGAVNSGITEDTANLPHHPSHSVDNGSMLPQFVTPIASQQNSIMAQYTMATAAQGFPGSSSNGGVNMQLYPTMVLNDQGILVPGMSIFPNPVMAMSQISSPMNLAASSATQANAIASAHHQQYSQQEMQHMYHQQRSQHHVNDGHDFEPLPIHQNSQGYDGYHQQKEQQLAQSDYMQILSNGNNSSKTIPSFDEFVAAPENLDTGGLSFGSMAMTDAELTRLQASLASSSFHHKQAATRGRPSNNHMYNHYPRQQHQQRYHDHDIVPAAPSSLEPTGISIGDVSMMSAATNNMKLEDTGTSFGTMMSFNTTQPAAVDGGLEAIGASFGSLSLDLSNRDSLFRLLEAAAAGPEVPPMFPSEAKSYNNLLECSDTESENSEDKEKLVQQKSEAWERMKSQIAPGPSLMLNINNGPIESHDIMRPPLNVTQVPPVVNFAASEAHQPICGAPFVNTEVTVPATTLENNLSTLSAWGAADDFYDDDYVGGDGDAEAGVPPPQALRKEDCW